MTRLFHLAIFMSHE